MANIFRVYKDSQVTTDRIRAEAAADSIVTPARVVYVFGTADDVAPNFTTVAGAITYANSLTPIVTEPVVVRLFTKADGTPYDLAGLSSWTTYANSYIYFVSDFVRLNETTTLPTTLPSGQQVWYIDPNGVETLWVGREDGSAWPAVGYKEYVAQVAWDSVENTVEIQRVYKNDFSTNTTISNYSGVYAPGFTLTNSVWNGNNMILSVNSYGTEVGDTPSTVIFYESLSGIASFGTSSGSTSGTGQIVSIRVFE
jgi:hypothetical protein